MINVVGAGSDPEDLTPPTFYSFTPKQKQAPAPVKPVAQVPTTAPIATPVATEPVAPSAPPVQPELPPDITPLTAAQPIPTTSPSQPPRKTKKLLVAGIIGLLVLIGGISAAMFLGQTNQDVRQQASTIQDETTRIPTTAPEPTAEPEPTQPVLDDVETLALAPTLSPTPTLELTPTPTFIDTTEYCGQSCAADENCQNPTHVCTTGSCRLSSNPMSTSCKTPSGNTQIEWDSTQNSRQYTPYAELSGETPQSGPENWLKYGWLGIGVLGIGATLLLFL